MRIDNSCPSWVADAKAALARGRAAYREAAEIILAARADDPTLTYEIIGEHLGHGRAWVSRLLQWYIDGAPERGVFAEEVAARRARQKAVSSPKHVPQQGVVILPEQPWLPTIDASPLDAAPVEESQRLEHLAKAAADAALHSAVMRERIFLLYGRSPERQRKFLDTLADALGRSLKASDAALDALRQVLQQDEPSGPTSVKGGWKRIRNWVLDGGIDIDELASLLGLERKSTWGDTYWWFKVIHTAFLTQASRHAGRGKRTDVGPKVMAVYEELLRRMEQDKRDAA